MWLLMLEAGMALFLLIFIVWWTMFHGANPPPHDRPPQSKNDDSN